MIPKGRTLRARSIIVSSGNPTFFSSFDAIKTANAAPRTIRTPYQGNLPQINLETGTDKSFHLPILIRPIIDLCWTDVKHSAIDHWLSKNEINYIFQKKKPVSETQAFSLEIRLTSCRRLLPEQRPDVQSEHGTVSSSHNQAQSCGRIPQSSGLRHARRRCPHAASDSPAGQA